ncbi:MAG: hypothetical protein WCA27_27750, partial [Candidatus Sulfotelmatobacter sp.]
KIKVVGVGGGGGNAVNTMIDGAVGEVAADVPAVVGAGVTAVMAAAEDGTRLLPRIQRIARINQPGPHKRCGSSFFCRSE